MPAPGDEAPERLEKLLAFHEKAPEDDFTTYAIAMEHAGAGAVEEALRWLERTLRLRPDHAYAWYQKAVLLAGAGRDDEARRALEGGLTAAEAAGDGKAAGELAELREDLGL